MSAEAVYNKQRPHRSLLHRSLLHRATPPPHAARPIATPGNRAGDSHDRVRTDRVNADGKLTCGSTASCTTWHRADPRPDPS